MSSQDNLLSLDRISIVYNKKVADAANVANHTLKVLKNSGLQAIVDIAPFPDYNASLVITVGGDGTLLKAARFCAPKGIPVLGINLGRLGFLAQLNPDEIPELPVQLIERQYFIQNRMMLSSFNDILALNDIVIKGDTFSRTSKLFLSINDRVVCDYLADGIIISTPTGSTAYTLSAGGPVIMPEVEAVVIVPICPHTLTARPLVIPASEKISISSCKSCTKLKLSADGQETIDVDFDKPITIEKSSIMAKLVILKKENNGFYSILRKKLQWGVGPER